MDSSFGSALQRSFLGGMVMLCIIVVLLTLGAERLIIWLAHHISFGFRP